LRFDRDLGGLQRQRFGFAHSHQRRSEADGVALRSSDDDCGGQPIARVDGQRVACTDAFRNRRRVRDAAPVRDPGDHRSAECDADGFADRTPVSDTGADRIANHDAVSRGE